VLLEIELDSGRPLTGASAVDERWQLSIAIGPDDQAYVLHAIEQLATQPLRHATRYAEYRIVLHPALDLAKPTDHPLFGVLPDCAGVDQNDIGAVGLVDRLIAGISQLAEHELGVTDVHLTAVSFDVDCGTRH
jgi:hypothetical protein